MKCETVVPVTRDGDENKIPTCGDSIRKSTKSTDVPVTPTPLLLTPFHVIQVLSLIHSNIPKSHHVSCCREWRIYYVNHVAVPIRHRCQIHRCQICGPDGHKVCSQNHQDEIGCLTGRSGFRRWPGSTPFVTDRRAFSRSQSTLSASYSISKQTGSHMSACEWQECSWCLAQNGRSERWKLNRDRWPDWRRAQGADRVCGRG